MKKQIFAGLYLTLEVIQATQDAEGKLEVTLKEGTNVDELRASCEDPTDVHEVFTKLSPDLAADGTFTLIHPAKVGAFIEGVVIGTDVTTDENGDIDETDDTVYYCFVDPEDRDPIDILVSEGKVTFTVAE